jgi:para-aminobenzoate synthetase / 4-amino-4-deoxychorismate lyase
MNYVERASKSPNSILLVTARAAHESRLSYFFENPEYTFTLRCLDDYPKLLASLDDAVSKGLYAAGYIGYECGYANEPSLRPLAPQHPSLTPLAWFGFYRHAISFKYVREPPPEITLPDTTLGILKEDYIRKIADIKSHIWAGDTYQVNFTTRLHLTSSEDPGRFFAHLLSVQPVEFAAFINFDGQYILSASPELFFRRRGNEIITRPMKGTLPRGFNLQQQRDNIEFLNHDAKNRSENVMIVDLLRNDLRRICSVNSVKVVELCAVETFPTVLQMTSTITGNLNPSSDYSTIFRALFPCGSITGAPKVRTMQIIREMEDTPRGVYTGTIGFISPRDEAVFNVAIRTIVLKDGKGEMGIGGGITWDSKPLDEYEECLVKAEFLRRSSPYFGLLETILWDGKYMYLDEHLSRLASSAEYFEFPCDTSTIAADLIRLSSEFPAHSQQRVRLVLSPTGTFQITSTELDPRANSSIDSAGVAVLISNHRTCADDVFLHHKTTNRAIYNREYSGAMNQGYGDVIFFNTDDRLTEGAIHNIFIVKESQWYTPPTSDGVLAGVLRSHLVRSGKIREGSLSRQDLISASEVYLGNSVRGLRKVTRISEDRGPGGCHTVWERSSGD